MNKDNDSHFRNKKYTIPLRIADGQSVIFFFFFFISQSLLQVTPDLPEVQNYRGKKVCYVDISQQYS